MWMELDGGAPALMFHFGVALNDVQLACAVTCMSLMTLKEIPRSVCFRAHALIPKDACFMMPQDV